MQEEATQLAPERYVLDVTIPGLPGTYNAIGMKSRWVRHRNTQTWKANVRAAVGRYLPREPLKRARASFVRCSSNSSDFENLTWSFKCVLDGLVSCGVLANDARKNVDKPSYDWEYAPPKRGFIRIRVEEVQE